MNNDEREMTEEEAKQEVVDFLKETGLVIKPCPFCGNKDDFDFTDARDQYDNAIICNGCGAILGGWGQDRGLHGWKEAIEKWNKRVEPIKLKAAVEMGKLGGAVGGPARAKALSPERRSEIASEAAKKRWANKSNTPNDITLPPEQNVSAKDEKMDAHWEEVLRQARKNSGRT